VFSKPVTNPGPVAPQQQPQQQQPQPPQKKSGRSFALIALAAVLAIVVAAGGAGLIGYKLLRGGKLFGFGRDANQASALPLAGSTEASATSQTAQPPPRRVEQNAVELANTTSNALSALNSTSPQEAQTQDASAQPPANSQQSGSTVARSSNDSTTGRQPRQPQNDAGAATPSRTVARQQSERTSAPPPRPSTIAFAVQGDAGLIGAVSDALSSELSVSGLEVVDAEDLPATEGMRGASAGSLVDRLRGNAGVLVLAKIEPTGQREIHYMGRYDLVYGSRITVTVYDVASGKPIGTRGNANIEYTQLSASREAEKAVGPLARKAVSAIENR
jgi:hypothetical protein